MWCVTVWKEINDCFLFLLLWNNFHERSGFKKSNTNLLAHSSVPYSWSATRLNWVLYVWSHQAEIKVSIRLQGRIHFQVYSGCCQDPVPCDYETEVSFPCWRLDKGYSLLLKITCILKHMGPSILKPATSSQIPLKVLVSDFLFCHRCRKFLFLMGLMRLG